MSERLPPRPPRFGLVDVVSYLRRAHHRQRGCGAARLDVRRVLKRSMTAQTVHALATGPPSTA
jgi:hypothetical protein